MEENAFIPLSGRPIFIKITVLLLLVVFCGAVFGLLGSYTAANLYGYTVDGLLENIDSLEPGALRIVQAFYTVGAFLVPALIFAQLNSKYPHHYLGNTPIGVKVVLAGLVLIVASSFVVDSLVYLTYHFPYPASLDSWIEQLKSQQDIVEEQTNVLLQMNSFGGLLINLLVMAILPALSEEFLFRGVIQKLMRTHGIGIHPTVWFASFMFAALHQSYFYFFGLLFLGVIFGYLKEWTGNIWLGVLLHFINNGSLVLISYYFPELLSTEVDSINVIMLVLGISLTIASCVFIYKNGQSSGIKKATL